MEEGKYGAIATAARIDKTENDAVYIEFDWLIGTGAGDEKLTKRFYIASGKEKGCKVLTKKLDQLKESFGWDGQDIYWFENQSQENTLGDIQVRVVIKADDWTDKKGKLRAGWDVAFINPATGGEPGTNNEKARLTRDEFRDKFAAKFRAVSGPAVEAPRTPGKAPQAGEVYTPAPAGKPTPSAKAGPAKPNRKPVAPVGSTYDDCWAAMEKKAEEIGSNEESRDAAWFRICEGAAPGAAQEAITPAQWGEVLKAIGELLPF